MSSATQQIDASVSTPEPHIEQFVDWHCVSGPDEPTEEELQNARENTLELGNRTEIHYEADEVPKSEKAKYHKLNLHNRDDYWKYRSDVDVQHSNDFQFKRHVVLAFAGQLDMSDLEQQIAIERMLELDLQRMGVRLEMVAFCVCARVSNRDPMERYRDGDRLYQPQRNDENNPEAFVRLQNHIIDVYGTVTKGAIQSVFQKLAQGALPRKTDDKENHFNNTSVVECFPFYNRDGTIAPAEHPNHGG